LNHEGHEEHEKERVGKKPCIVLPGCAWGGVADQFARLRVLRVLRGL